MFNPKISKPRKIQTPPITVANGRGAFLFIFLNTTNPTLLNCNQTDKLKMKNENKFKEQNTLSF